MNLRTLLPLAALCAATSPSFGLCRWLGDDLSKNNPPVMNVNLPAGVQNSFVRILLNSAYNLKIPAGSHS